MQFLVNMVDKPIMNNLNSTYTDIKSKQSYMQIITKLIIEVLFLVHYFS